MANELLNLPNDVLRAVIEAMGAALTPSFVGKLEPELGHSGQRIIHAMYETIYKRIFPNVPKDPLLSAKEDLLIKVGDILKKLAKHRDIHLSVNEFFEAATDTKKYLSVFQDDYADSHEFEYPLWEQTIWYAHHIEDTRALPKNDRIRNTLIRATADFFALTKNYPALERLFEKHKELLEKGETYDYKYREYEHIKTPEDLAFTFYAEYGHIEKVKKLLKSNPSQNLCISVYSNALFHHGNMTVVKLLKNHLEHSFGMIKIPLSGGDLLENKKDYLSLNALHGNLEAIKFLIANYFPDGGPIGLEMELTMRSAAEKGHSEIVIFLLKHLAKQEKSNQISPEISQTIKETAFFYSAQQGNSFPIKALLLDPVFKNKVSDDFKDKVFKQAATYEWIRGTTQGKKRTELLELLHDTLGATDACKIETFLKSTEKYSPSFGSMSISRSSKATFQFLFNILSVPDKTPNIQKKPSQPVLHV